MSDDARFPVIIKPIVNYPGEVEPGKTYRLTADLCLSADSGEWRYPEEEYAVHLTINPGSIFSLVDRGDATIVLHRYIQERGVC